MNLRIYIFSGYTLVIVAIALARRAGDPGLNPGPDENFSFKLLIYDLSDGYSEN